MLTIFILILFIPILLISALLRRKAVIKKNGETQSSTYYDGQAVDINNPAIYVANNTFNFAIATSIFILIVVLLSSVPYFYKKTELINSVEIHCSHPEGDDLIGIYGDLSSYRRVVSTNSKSNVLFNQGLLHIFGFNQLEAIYNFNVALKYDPNCLMCYVGLLCSYSPNINTFVSDEMYTNARIIINEAYPLLNRTKQSVETSLFLAHSLKFPESFKDWQRNGQNYYEVLYLESISELSVKYPVDVDILVWHAEAIINLTPWNYYTPSNSNYNANKTISSNILSSIQYLKDALTIEPTHPLALHLLIHIYEQHPTPQLGKTYADTLHNVHSTRSTSHLLHMPGHIYCRIGDYNKCVSTGIAAIQLDNYYEERCLLPYVPLHNRALLVSGALASGNLQLSLQYSLSITELPPESAIFVSALYPIPKELLLVRFGKWKDILSLHHIEPNNNFLYTLQPLPAYSQSILLYAIILSLIRIKDIQKATEYFKLLNNTVATIPVSSIPNTSVFYPFHQEIGNLLVTLVNAAFLSESNKYKQAILLLKNAVVIQEAFYYMEPETFFFPIRQCLGGLYIKLADELEYDDDDVVDYKKRRKETLELAIFHFELDLRNHPNNVNSLKGIEIGKRLLVDDSTNFELLIGAYYDADNKILNENIMATSTRTGVVGENTTTPARGFFTGPCCEFGLC